MVELIKGPHFGDMKQLLKKYNQKLIVFLLCMIFCTKVFSQAIDSTGIVQQFNNYQAHNFQEKVFMHTDKNFYLSGETVWFKIYDVDEFFNKPNINSNISYIELIDNNNHAILHAKISLKDGAGNGSFTIPTSIPSGHFLLRAYTSWMKNFAADLYFEKAITVMNTVNKIHFKNAAYKDSGIYDIQFFPEGGNLVAGLESKVGFKITDIYGKGIEVSGIVIDEDGKTVANFKTLKLGMGNFIFTPQQEIHYRAVIKVKDTNIIKSLPDAFAKGYTMRVDDTDLAMIKISVFSNIFSNNVSYLFIQSHNLIKEVQIKPVLNNKAVFYVDKAKLGDGISQLTIFDAQKQPVCERLYFKKPAHTLNISATVDKQNYSKRNKGSVEIKASGMFGETREADLSMAIVQIDTLQKIDSLNILNYLLLVSDLKGTVESPDYYFQDDTMAKQAADNLMLTQGWRRFKWEDVIKDSKPQFAYLPEKEGFLINGKVFNKMTNEPAKNITSYLSIPGKSFLFSTSVSDGNGNILFDPGKFYGEKEMIIQTNNTTKDSLYKIEISNPYSDKFTNSSLPDLSFSKDLTSVLTEKSIEMQVDNSVDLKHKFQYKQNINNDSLNFYGKPDQQYYLDNYTRFLSMEEVLHEYVIGLHIKNQDDNYIFSVGNDSYKNFFDNPPLVLIDGVPVFDNRKLMEINPLKIKKLDMVSRKFYSGPLTSDGIMSFGTYNGDLSGYELDPAAVVLEYEGLQNECEFYTPIYNDKERVNSHLPDFRNVLLWDPNIIIHKNDSAHLSFYTSDIAGKFAVIIQGFSTEGLCGYKTLTFDVAK